MAQPEKHIVVFHKKGPKWPDKGLSFDDPIAQKHAGYFGKLFKEGIIIQGGPFPGKGGGMMIFKKEATMDEVKKIAEADPAVKSGVMDYEVKSWMRVFGK